MKPWIAATLLALTTTDVVASQASADPLSLVQTSVGLCGQSRGQYEGTARLMRAYGATPLPENLATLGAPQDLSAEFQGFSLDADGGPYLVGVSRGKFKAKTIISCSVAAAKADVEAVVTDAMEIPDLGEPKFDWVEMGQHNRTWEISEEGQNPLFNIMDGTPARLDSVTLSLSTLEAE